MIKRHVPPNLWYSAARALGHTVVRPIDLARAELLRRPDVVAVLDDPERLPFFIRELGISDEHPHIQPPGVQHQLGSGLRLNQSPHQLAAYLLDVAQRPIRSYIEFGLQHGGTFVATVTYLEARGHRIERAVGVDPAYCPGIVDFARGHPAVAFRQTTSQDPAIVQMLHHERWDLALIDGDHAYAACRADLDLAVAAGVRTIVLHDIVDVGCPGVRQVWAEARDELAEDFVFSEHVQQYPEVTAWTRATHYGIGVARRRED